MDDLEELKARSTTQYRDEMKRAGITDKDLDAFDYDLDLDADYEPESYDPDDEPGDAESDDPGILPGIVQAILPRQQRQHEDRERVIPSRTIPSRRFKELEGSSIEPMLLHAHGQGRWKGDLEGTAGDPC